MRARTLIVIAALADVVTGVAVFLPWAGVNGDPAALAGWGSSATPRLAGLFVLACAATALTIRAGAVIAEAEDRMALHIGATLLDGAGAILVLTVVTGAGAFVGTTEPAGARPGALLALGAAVVGVAAGIVSLATTPRVLDREARGSALS